MTRCKVSWMAIRGSPLDTRERLAIPAILVYPPEAIDDVIDIHAVVLHSGIAS